MGIKIKVFNLVVIIVASISIYNCKFSTNKEPSKISREESVIRERTKLKKFAFCSCIGRAYDNFSETYNDGSASEYLQQSAYGPEMYRKIGDFAEKWLNTNNDKYLNFQNYELGLKKCLDFYESEELKKEIMLHDKDLNIE